MHVGYMAFSFCKYNILNASGYLFIRLYFLLDREGVSTKAMCGCLSRECESTHRVHCSAVPVRSTGRNLNSPNFKNLFQNITLNFRLSVLHFPFLLDQQLVACTCCYYPRLERLGTGRPSGEKEIHLP